MTTSSGFKLSSISQQISPLKRPSCVEALSGSSTYPLPRPSEGCFTIKPYCGAGKLRENFSRRRQAATAYSGHKTPYKSRRVNCTGKHRMAHAKPPSAATAVPPEPAKVGELENAGMTRTSLQEFMHWVSGLIPVVNQNMIIVSAALSLDLYTM
jgi:hypothetical protein